MGKEFGNLAFIRGIIYYRLSPFELRPFARAISFGLPNFIPRTRATVLTWLPVFVSGLILRQAAEADHARRKRKNPADYVNEVDPNPPAEEETKKKNKC